LDDFSRDYYLNLEPTTSIYVPDIANYQRITISDGLFIGLDQHTQSLSIGTVINDYKLSFSQSRDLFGSESSGALALTNASTNYISVDTPSYYGWSSSLTCGLGTADSSGLISDISNLLGMSAKIEYTESNFNLGIKSPMTVISGTANLSVPMTRDMEGNISYQNQSVSLANKQAYNLYTNYTYIF
jgi:hypothetical protein